MRARSLPQLATAVGLGYGSARMPDGAAAGWNGVVAWVRADRARALLALAAGLGALGVVCTPFFVVTYPPLTDLPFHAAQTAVLRHYSDPAWHFREQFTLHPLEVPYVSVYALGALLACFVSIETAMKIVTAVSLLTLPSGLALLCHAAKKSPLLGLAALGLVWGSLTHWGFLNFVAALGLHAGALGAALLVLDRPTRGRVVGLTALLGLLYFTHPFRVPFTLLAIGVAALLVPEPRARWRGLVVPVGLTTLGFAAWLVSRPSGLAMPLSSLSFDLARLTELRVYLFDGFDRRTEAGVSEQRIMIAMGAVLAALTLGGWLLRRRESRGEGDAETWRRRTSLVALVVAAGHLLSYLTLPMSMGPWWYVYPREAAAALLIALAALPDLPRARRAAFTWLTATLLAAGSMTLLVTREWAQFEAVTADFRELLPLIPRAPRLSYLVFDRTGTHKTHTPFLHLPAWVQAEKGGWLGFHFASWGMYPARYREGGDVPPSVPQQFEWKPQDFRVLEHGAWFDTFLVRHNIDPSRLFAADPSIRLVEQRGTWWLYRRDGATPPR